MPPGNEANVLSCTQVLRLLALQPCAPHWKAHLVSPWAASGRASSKPDPRGHQQISTEHRTQGNETCPVNPASIRCLLTPVFAGPHQCEPLWELGCACWRTRSGYSELRGHGQAHPSQSGPSTLCVSPLLPTPSPLGQLTRAWVGVGCT